MAKKIYNIKNTDKYIGKNYAISYRSSWELDFMRILDNSESVLRWLSEPKHFCINYYNPIFKKTKTYWPDFYIEYKNGAKEILEIKPFKETSLTEKSTKYDKLMIIQNMAKWKAGKEFADKVGITFRVLTEKQLYKGGRK